MLCSYPGDAGSSGRPNGGCDAHPYVGSVTKAPAWRPGDDLETMMKQQADPKYQHGKFGASGYNELIMESKPYADLLPHSIDAVFYQPDSTGAQIRQAKLTHENFLREYGDAVKGVPLVIYEGRVNRQSKRPFKLAPGNSSDCFISRATRWRGARRRPPGTRRGAPPVARPPGRSGL